MVIKLDEQGKPTGFPLLEENFKQIHPHVAFPQVLFPADVEPHGYGMYEFSQQPQVTERYGKLVEGEPVRDENGYWRQQWFIIQQTDAEKVETDKRKAESVRRERNLRLALCDWTRLDDNGLSVEKKSAWSAYRQGLRDVPSQSGFPWNVVWPVQP